MMGYQKAIDLLPEELLLMIQDYVDGEYIYIPRREDNKKAWGETTRAKEVTVLRNVEIYKKYEQGKSSKELAEEYCLSLKSIQGIIARMKRRIA